MEEQGGKFISIIGIIIAISIIGAIVCGILECFGLNTGIIGGVFGVVPILFLAIFILYQVFKGFSS